MDELWNLAAADELEQLVNILEFNSDQYTSKTYKTISLTLQTRLQNPSLGTSLPCGCLKTTVKIGVGAVLSLVTYDKARVYCLTIGYVSVPSSLITRGGRCGILRLSKREAGSILEGKGVVNGELGILLPWVGSEESEKNETEEM